MMSAKKRILVTGSSGYVASYLIPTLSKHFSTMGVDLFPSEYTDIVSDISDNFISTYGLSSSSYIVINLAAARFDFGAKPEEYYKKNITDHINFLKNLESVKVDKFIQISSVAALDGRNIPFSDNLNCDDAYRSTKYLQEELIEKWCKAKNIELTTLYPSAIFSDDPRPDTNIGKLQSISKITPFIPNINVKKSLTYLPSFTKFITDAVLNKIPAGKYLTIEKPTLTVSKMIQIISRRKILLINIPFFENILKLIAYFLYALGGFGKFDLKLMPNRVIKLYSDTSYDGIESQDINLIKYTTANHDELSIALGRLNE
jgi:nucleoside-diphosphate-sugar epimerase